VKKISLFPTEEDVGGNGGHLHFLQLLPLLFTSLGLNLFILTWFIFLRKHMLKWFQWSFCLGRFEAEGRTRLTAFKPVLLMFPLGAKDWAKAMEAPPSSFPPTSSSALHSALHVSWLEFVHTHFLRKHILKWFGQVQETQWSWRKNFKN